MKRFLLALSLSFLYLFSQAQCDGFTEASITIVIYTDDFAYETSFDVTGADGTVYASADPNTYSDFTLYETTFCAPYLSCLTFNIYDSFGDGICCGYGDGYYEVYMNNSLLATGGDFGDADSFTFNCSPGESCGSSLSVGEGTHTAEFDDSWYEFVPDSVGTYTITTCGTNTCDTELWVYDSCTGITISESNTGTIFYDDNDGGCGSQALIVAALDAGVPILIRVGDADDDCSGTITWAIDYNGPVIGCMDPNSCNYQPLATVDDGSCLPQGHPGCPNGPDLLMRQDVLETSIYLTTLDNTDGCAINEGCLTGYGIRDVLRFTTHIQNIGTTDYYIGDPNDNPDQFTYDNCHGHNHYDGYAEYVLFDANGTELPIGFKNGFCVIDLECSGGGSAQYGCGNMGITAGCGDIYHSSLECQWIDVTDVPDGTYTFVTRVNWDFAPDALGQLESDTVNNWAQVCINLDRSSGDLVFTLDSNCNPYIDCAGEIYGSTQPDCTGLCGGTTVMGDLDGNGLQEVFDAQQYVMMMISDDIDPTSCNDLNDDAAITVYDAALLSNCLNYGAAHQHPQGGTHDHCNFPDGVMNTLDSSHLSIIDYDFTNNWVDIGIRNPNSHVVAYQFEMEGLMIQSVQSLVDANDYPITPQYNFGEQMVIGISYEDSLITKSDIAQPLVRIYFMDNAADTICISNVLEVVNDNYEQTLTFIEGDCAFDLSTSVSNVFVNFEVQVQPNPFDRFATVRFQNPGTVDLELVDVHGKVLRQERNFGQSEWTIERGDLAKGIYFFNIQSQGSSYTGKLVVQ
ncbi:MAG: lysyl oxidase family protein [Bacteroidota bacterium]